MVVFGWRKARYDNSVFMTDTGKYYEKLSAYI